MNDLYYVEVLLESEGTKENCYTNSILLVLAILANSLQY